MLEVNGWNHNDVKLKLKWVKRHIALQWLNVFWKVAVLLTVHTSGEDLVWTKSTKTLCPWYQSQSSFWGSPHQPQHYQSCIYKRQTERSQWIFNGSSVWNFEQAQIDSWFFNRACGSFQNCWLFLSRDWQTSTAGGGLRYISSIFSHTLNINFRKPFKEYPVQSVVMLFYVTWWHWESNT